MRIALCLIALATSPFLAGQTADTPPDSSVNRRTITLEIPAQPLPSAIETLQTRLKELNLPGLNIVLSPTARNASVPSTELRIEEPQDALSLLALAAGGEAQPIGSYDAGRVIGFKVFVPDRDDPADGESKPKSESTMIFSLGHLGGEVSREFEQQLTELLGQAFSLSRLSPNVMIHRKAGILMVHGHEEAHQVASGVLMALRSNLEASTPSRSKHEEELEMEVARTKAEAREQIHRAKMEAERLQTLAQAKLQAQEFQLEQLKKQLERIGPQTPEPPED